MANILYRGATPSAANTTTGGVSRPLTNDEIDKNFYALNALKLESESDTLGTVTGRGSTTNTNLTFNGTNNFIKALTGVASNHLYISGANTPGGTAYDVRITGGWSYSGNGVGGTVSLDGGLSNGNASGGQVRINGGVGGTDREGGFVLIRGGAHGPSGTANASAGRGGDVEIVGGYGGSGGNSTGGARGGNVSIKPGIGGVATPASTYIYAPTAGVANVNSGQGSEVIAAEFNSSIIKLRTAAISFGSQFSGTVEVTTETTFGGTTNAASSNLSIVTGESWAQGINNITITPGVTTKTLSNSKGSTLTLVGGRAATGTSAYVKTGGDVYIDGGYGAMWSGTDSGYGGTIHIGTTANGNTSGSVSQAGTRIINIGNVGYGDPLGGPGQYIAPSITNLSGQIVVANTSTFRLYGDLIASNSCNVFLGNSDGYAGFISYDTLDDMSFGFAALYDKVAVNYKCKSSDIYPTRMLTGLTTGFSQGCTFKFQRASSKVFNSVISWIDDLSITNAGDIRVRSNIYAGGDIIAYYTSDETLKTNIVKIDSALAKVNSLDGITFNWNEAAEEKFQKDVNVREAGVIAQQVKAVLPEVVKTREDGTLAVKYDQIVPLLIEAIKELTSKVEDLQNQLMNK